MRTQVPPFHVTGVLVVHDGAAWLTECLDAIAAQTHPPDRLVIVDTGSVDDSLQILSGHVRIRQVVGDVQTISTSRSCTFGEAVARAVDRLSEPSDAITGVHWLWLLHDDSAAAPEALAHLLDAARRSPSVGVAGPKLMTWQDPSRLLEVGSTITRSGLRAGGPVIGEPDQGQYDHRTDVLGVNTSGMLIRRDLFDAVGGFDPAFGQFRDDLDLCWRAHLAGYRVVVAPRARIREAAASTNGRRSPDLSPGAARRTDRSHGREVALARCSPYAVPLLALWIALSSLASALVLLVVKRPREAWAELGDLGVLMSPLRLVAVRKRSRGLNRVPRRYLRGLFASPRVGFQERLSLVQDIIAVGSAPSVENEEISARSLETGPVAEGGEPIEAPARGVASRILLHPGFLAVLVAALLAGATWRRLVGALIATNGSGAAGGELLPASGDASGLWHAWLDGWHGAGLGTSLESPPYLPFLSAAAWAVEHLPFADTVTSSVGVTIAWLLAAAIPLSAWTAYLGARVVTHAPWPRAWAALAWASLATVTTATATGRLGAVVAHLLLPLVAAGFACAARRSASIAVTCGTALALGAAAAFNPLVGAVGACAAFVLLVVGRGATRLRAVVLLLVPVAMLGPWLLRLVDNPLLVLAGPGLTVWHSGGAAPWQLVLLNPGGPGSYPALLSAPILLAGVVAMSRRGGGSAMTVLATITLTGLALGLAAPHVIIGHALPGAAGAAGAVGPITGWAGTGLDLAGLALIAAAVLGLGGLRTRASRTEATRRRVLVAPVAVAAVLGVAASVVMAGWVGVGGILKPNVPNVPAVAADQADGPSGSRLLELTGGAAVVRGDAGTVGYRLVGREPGQVARDLPGELPAPDPALATAVRATVGDGAPTSAGGVGDGTSAIDARDALAAQGVAFVAVRGALTGSLALRLDATAGLTRLSDNQGLILWRVLPGKNAVGPSRLRLVGADGTPLAAVPVSGEHGRTEVSLGPAKAGTPALGRRLVVAEPAGWAEHARVRFGGRELASVTGGGQPTYLLPPSAGRLSITVAPTHQWWRWAQLGLLVVVLFLAVPRGSTRASRATSSGATSSGATSSRATSSGATSRGTG